MDEKLIIKSLENLQREVERLEFSTAHIHVVEQAAKTRKELELLIEVIELTGFIE